MHEKVGVEKVEVENGRVCGVRTSRGNIKCEIFVNCGGLVSCHFGDHVYYIYGDGGGGGGGFMVLY